MNASPWIVGGAVVGVLILISLILIPVLVIRFARAAQRPFPDGVITTGQVIDHELFAMGDGGHTVVPVYRFVDEAGVARSARDQIGDRGKLEVGSTMQISYRPQDPTRVRRLHRHSTGGATVVG